MLTVHELQQRIIQRRSQNHETYKHLYDIVHRRIKRSFGTDASVTRLKYTVPAFKVDRPRYEPHRAARYIRDKLRRGGFGVEIDRDGVTLNIDWSVVTDMGAHELKRSRQQQQQRQASSPSRRHPRQRMSRDDIASRLQALKQKLRA
jgi:hypothetical protein